jgi:isopenicillin N synthase-like dioxygenase
VPVIDLAGSDAAVASEVASACEEWGFFQVVNHGVDAGVTARWEAQMRAFFALPTAEKAAIRRHAGNARGFFDDELTKQKRDWKEALDFGVTPSRDWSLADGDAANANLDGFNQFPPASRLPAFRPAMHAYFDACTSLAERLTEIFALGLGLPRDHFTEGERLREAHTSYLRMNYYPTCAEPGEPPPLGISPHKDAGFLTVLKQDDDCHSLQVRRRGAPDDDWSTVHPVPGALTVNTGDMAQARPPARPPAPARRRRHLATSTCRAGVVKRPIPRAGASGAHEPRQGALLGAVLLQPGVRDDGGAVADARRAALRARRLGLLQSAALRR